MACLNTYCLLGLFLIGGLVVGIFVLDSMANFTNSASEEASCDEEREAILQCQKGNKQAYGYLVKKYMKRAYFIALGFVGSHENALDLSQEAFVRAFRAIGRMDVNRKFFTWYYQILRNLCFNFLRDRARHARPFAEISDMELRTIPDKTENAEEILERKEIQEAVWKALDELRPHEREIILLKDFQDLSYKEIAEVLNCPIGTVMSRLFNARKALKTKLKRYLA